MTDQMHLRHLKEIADAWTAAALDPAATAVVSDAVDRIEQIRSEARDLDAASGVSTKELASRIAGGEIGLREAVIEAAAARSWVAPTSTSYKKSFGNTLRELSEKVAIRVAMDALRTDAPRLLGDLTAAFENAQSEAAKLPPEINKVGSAENAIEAGPKVAAAWPGYQDLLQRHTALVNAGRVLRRYLGTDPPFRYLFAPTKESAA